jgi:hypothetical protein
VKDAVILSFAYAAGVSAVRPSQLALLGLTTKRSSGRPLRRREQMQSSAWLRQFKGMKIGYARVSTLEQNHLAFFVDREGETVREIARTFNISHSTISRLKA